MISLKKKYTKQSTYSIRFHARHRWHMTLEIEYVFINLMLFEIVDIICTVTDWWQAIAWTNADPFSIGPFEIHFSEIGNNSQMFSFRNFIKASKMAVIFIQALLLSLTCTPENTSTLITFRGNKYLPQHRTNWLDEFLPLVGSDKKHFSWKAYFVWRQ